MGRLIISPRAAGLVYVVFLVTPCVAEETSDEAVRSFVERVNEASVTLLADGPGAPAREKTRALLGWAFDVPGMAEYALDDAWEKANDAERKELLVAFEEDIISGYLRRMSGPGTTLTFLGNRSPVDGYQFAASRREVPGKEDQTWIWRMRPEGKSFRIVDLLLDGLSAANSALNEYGNVFDNNDGDIKAVIAFMRSRAAK